MTPPEIETASAAALSAVASIPRDDAGPVFPAPWTATAFALTVTLHRQGLLTWPDWADRLGAAIAADPKADAADPLAYWCCWLAALETLLADNGLAPAGDLAQLQAAWRDAAEATPHGEPILLSQQVRQAISR